jgi:polyisoprenyl-phosphate glycosyltransferase
MDTRKKCTLSIVLPVLNEARLLPEVLTEIAECAARSGAEYEIIVVDDDSTDWTWEIIGALAEESPGIRGIRLSRTFGKESAIVSGIEAASGDAVIVMNADLQHPPALIPEMVAKWREGTADIIEAVKVHRGREPLSSSLAAKFFSWLLKRLAGINLDNASDFKLLDRKVVDAHNHFPESSRFFRGIVFWLGFRKVQIPFSVPERGDGRSRRSPWKLIRLAVDTSTAYSSFPLHFVTLMGAVTLFVSMMLGIQTLCMKFSGHEVSGFTTVILLLLFIGSALMLSLGIIGLYISRIYEEVKRRPKFIVEDTINVARKK